MPAFVREGVASDDGLVDLDALTGQFGQELAGGEEPCVRNPVVYGSRSGRTRRAITISRATRLPAVRQRHYRAFDLPSPA